MHDFENTKKRVCSILDSKNPIEDEYHIPSSDSEFTYENGIRSWVTAIFVDIKDSSKIFKNEKEDIVSKIIRSFSSEIITILKSDKNFRDIGVRGDCVYGIYSTPSKNEIKNIYTALF